MSVKKIAVLTSGGDAPGMNAAIRSVVRTCAYHNIEVVGVYRGYQGMIEGDFEEMNARSVRDIINRGGTILKSARSKDFKTPEGRKAAYEKLKAAGVPTDIFYLILAESALRETAVSSAGAAGIWQFMPTTAKGYNLRVDEFIDERFNTEKATDAAIKYLKKPYDKF